MWSYMRNTVSHREHGDAELLIENSAYLSLCDLCGLCER